MFIASKTLLPLAATIFLAGCQVASQISLGSLIESHINARGGDEAIEGIHSLRLGLQIAEPSFSVRGDYIATRDGYMRIDIYSGDDRVFTEALGPDGGWQLLRGETVPSQLSEDGEEALMRGIVENLYGMHELPRLGYELSLPEDGMRQAKGSWAIDQVAPDGFLKRRYIDKQSFLIARELETSALHPDVDSSKTQQETHFFDYRASAGVLFPRVIKKKDSATGEIIQTVVVSTVEVNPEVGLNTFKRPIERAVQD